MTIGIDIVIMALSVIFISAGSYFLFRYIFNWTEDFSLMGMTISGGSTVSMFIVYNIFVAITNSLS